MGARGGGLWVRGVKVGRFGAWCKMEVIWGWVWGC